MSEPTIKCPKCGAEFPLDDAALAPILDSAQKKSAQWLESESNRIASEAASKAREELDSLLSEKTTALGEIQRQMREKEEKLALAQKEQAEALKLKLTLEDEKRELDLTIQKGIREGIETAREKAKKDVEEALSLRLKEKDLLIESLSGQIDEMKRKAEQGSQQAQGEVQEIALEEALRSEFPIDIIEPVEKGVRGADCIQRVRNDAGQLAGSILWESKRTKNWGADWLAKLRADQREVGAEIAILASQAMPEAGEVLTHTDGVWVCAFSLAIPLAKALRPMLHEVARSRQVASGQKTKTELIYAYLTGPQLKARVEAIVEAFKSMQDDLQAEKRALMKHWAKREKELEKVLSATTGMYGDLQGIAGSSVPEIEGFDIAQITQGSENPDE